MSREIKFRAWDNTKQQMFPVRELFWREDPYEMVGNYWFFENEDDEYGKEVWFPRTEANGSKHTAHLMQFIGMTDKNGKEIYEGDIVRGDRGDTWYAFQIESIVQGNSLLSTFEVSHREIIGNIYDNPEVVKG